MALARLLATTAALLLFAAPAAWAADVDFDPVAVGTTPDVQGVEFVNEGDDEITLGSTSLTGADPSAFSVDTPVVCTSVVLSPGEGCTIYLEFDPRRPGLSEATLEVPIADSAEVLRATLAGEGRASLRFSPSVLDFGTVPGSSTPADTRHVLVENVSGEELSGLRASAGAGWRVRITADTCSGLSLPPGGTCNLSIAFAGRTAGTYADAVSVTKASYMLGSLEVRGTIVASTKPPFPRAPRPPIHQRPVRTPDATPNLEARLDVAIARWRERGAASLRRGGFGVTALVPPVDGTAYLLVRARGALGKPGRTVARGLMPVTAGKRARLQLRATKAGRRLLAAKRATRLEVVLKFVATKDQRVSRVERTLRLPAR